MVRWIDAEDVGTEAREEPGAHRTGDHPGEVHHARTIGPRWATLDPVMRLAGCRSYSSTMVRSSATRQRRVAASPRSVPAVADDLTGIQLSGFLT